MNAEIPEAQLVDMLRSECDRIGVSAVAHHLEIARVHIGQIARGKRFFGPQVSEAMGYAQIRRFRPLAALRRTELLTEDQVIEETRRLLDMHGAAEVGAKISYNPLRLRQFQTGALRYIPPRLATKLGYEQVRTYVPFQEVPNAARG